MEILRCEGIKKVYGTGNNRVAALQKVDLSVEKGEFVAIVGASGSGKSTLLHILGSVDKPTEGKVIIEGTDISALNQTRAAIFRRRKVGLVYQFYNLIPNLTALENVELALQICKDPMDAREVMEEVGLGARLDNFPAQLSGGEQQRVAIARAVVNNPQVLLLDEPLGALDLQLRRQMQVELKRIQKRLGITFIYITHDQEEALNMSDRIVVMDNGRFEQVGTPNEVYYHPKTSYVARFVGTANMISGRLVKVWENIAYIDAEIGDNSSSWTRPLTTEGCAALTGDQ